MRRNGRFPVLAGTAAGLVVAAAVTILQASTYRADASIALVRQGRPPGDDPALAGAAEAAAELFHSRAVAEPAIANLRLDESADELLDRVDVEAEPGSSLVRVSVEAPSRDEARRTAQELTELATVLFNDRFGPETSATVWEAPRAREDRVAPRPARNLALGALLGALLGRALFWRRGPGGRRRPTGPTAGGRPDLNDARVAALTKRELELARRAAAVALRERATPGAPASVAPIAPAPAPASLAPAAPEAPAAPARFVEPRLGEWRLLDVELLLAEQGPAFPERVEELGFYVDSFRGVAAPDGRLPGGVEAIVEDVFGPLLARARTTSAA